MEKGPQYQLQSLMHDFLSLYSNLFHSYEPNDRGFHSLYIGYKHVQVILPHCYTQLQLLPSSSTSLPTC